MTVGEAFLSAFLQVLFDRLASKLILDIIQGGDVENELKRLQKTLKRVKAVVNDAEDKQFKSDEVKTWLDELKDASYDAEDVLDEFATEALRWGLEAETQASSHQVWNFIPVSLSPSIIKFNADIEYKIKEITTRFDELAKESFELRLEEVVARSSSSSSSRVRETSSVVDESLVYGRDGDKDEIIKLLVDVEPIANNKFSVIPIVGMGGVGKTTLVQIVYNDDRVERHFDLKAWVCVSDEFDVTKITKAILESVTFTSIDSSDLNRVQVEAKKAFAGKKFLIVLDDVWNKKYGEWDLLQMPFRVGAAGSAIIVTTRNGDVASMMGTVDYHHLQHLSDDDCWSLFVQHAFRNGNADANPSLVTIGKKIVKRCKGLPLVAKTLGGLLRSKSEEDVWEDILHSNIWDLPEDENDILPALRLSYHHLPSHLKRCFAYCSIFPYDYEFGKNEVVLLWMAEGFLQQPTGKKEMEDLGHEYFCELLSRSFFQPSSSDTSLFVMHDLIKDLAHYVAGETCFILEDLLEDNEQGKIFRKARHSSYIASLHDGFKKFEAFYEFQCLRTFLPIKRIGDWGHFLSNKVLLDLLPKLRYLRVISLSGYHITKLPSSIGDLKHLRYFDLSHTQLRSLPESTGTLYNLQTLILRDCSSLKKLPTGMENLINMRHLDISNAHSIKQMPPRIGKLTSLQTLSNFVVGTNSGSSVAELMNLKSLKGTLRVSRLENVIDARNAREAKLHDKKNLDELEMWWSFNFEAPRNEMAEKEVLEMLQPHKKLKRLTISGYGGMKFSTWIGDASFSNMLHLKLENCSKCTILPPLGQLPSLKDLYLKGMQ